MSTGHASRRRSISGLPTVVLVAVVLILTPMIAMGAAPPRNQPGETAPGVRPTVSTISAPARWSSPRWRSDRPLPIAPPITAYPSDRGFPTESPGTTIAGGRAMSSAKTAVASSTGGPGTPPADGACVFDEDCDDCDPCTLDECRAPVCVHTQQDACTTCSDGVFCNGMELCNDLGLCRPAPYNACVARPGTICDEAAGPTLDGDCVMACRVDADCDDNLLCTGVEVCTLRECVGGDNAGAPCTDDTPCTGTGGFCGGVCRSAGYPCGTATGCTEPVTCGTGTCDGGTGLCAGGSNNGRPCVNVTCVKGRCCTDDGSGEFLWCAVLTKPDCDAAGGRWLNIGFDPSTSRYDASCHPYPIGSYFPPPDIYFCPSYASGVAPEGDFVTVVGPVGAAVCNPIHEIGDDYVIATWGYGDYLALTAVRFVGAFQTDGIQGEPSRVRITFYDETGRFVADAVTNPFGGGGLQLHTVEFYGNPRIPVRGWITLQAFTRYAPFSRHFWATTDAVDTGGNDPALLWVNGAPASASSVLGDGVPGVLAFELVGYTVPAPSGACCGGGTDVCSEELPWVCDARGGYFWGIGTRCQTCANDSIQACVSDAECPTCVGGTYDGKACNVNYDCPGGTCTDGTCVGGANAGATCNPNRNCGSGGTCTGTAPCLDVPPACSTTACCDPASGVCTEVAGAACSDTGEPCLADADCVGAGATCRPPCPSGTTSQGFGTNCDPDCCEQPVATGWDTCAEADEPGNLAVLTVPPPGSPPIAYTFSGDNSLATFGDYGTNGDGTCGHDLFDPAGETRDRGWWHAFQIDSCAVVQIDRCCSTTRSGQSGGPRYAALWTGCDPCGSTVYASMEAEAFLHSPFEPADCDDGSGGLIFHGPLPAGTYYYPIYSGVNATRGEYQLHITVAGCPTAACCLPDDTCQELDHLACDAVDGRWQAQILCGDPGCSLSRLPCTEGRCATGACCTGLGQCSDRADPGTACNPSQPSTCMDRTRCNALGGSYTPGVQCDEEPCPTCGVLSESNCQVGTTPYDGLAYMSDLSAFGNGVVSADDFIPFGDTLSSLCVWGTYLDPTLNNQYPNLFECTGQVADHFRVRVFRDDGGLPGALVGQSEVTGAHIVVAEEATSRTPQFYGRYEIPYQVHTLTLDAPITGLMPGEVHWLEVANATFEPLDNQCSWHWAQHLASGRDGYCASGISPGGSSNNVTGAPSIYGRGSERGGVDLAFCLQGPGGPLTFESPAAPLACCWKCDHTNAILSLFDCAPNNLNPGIWNGGDPSCTQPAPQQVNDTCSVWPGASTASSSGSCGDGVLDSGEQCDDGNTTPGDGCDENCGLECYPVEPPIPDIRSIREGAFSFDTACATNDGPTLIRGEGGNFGFGGDLWYEYRASCTGFLVADMCATQIGFTQGGFSAIDGAIALYHDFDDPLNCPCPGPFIGVSPLQAGLGSDEGCTGVVMASSGVVRQATIPNECWLIRVGGFEGCKGRGLLSIACERVLCVASSPPMSATVPNAGGATVALRNNRFVSFQGGDPGRNQAVRLKFSSLPPPWDVWNGTALFVGPPFLASEAPSHYIGAPPAPGVPFFKAARLQCEPEFRDWSLEGVVHVFHDAIVPSRLQSPGSGVIATPAVYELQLIGDLCNTARPQDYGPPLTITNAGWGDVGELAVGQFRAADNKVGIDDALSVLAKFTSAGSATTKPRNELVGVTWSGPVVTIDGKIDVSDILAVINAFGGGNFPFAAPAPSPCP